MPQTNDPFVPTLQSVRRFEDALHAEPSSNPGGKLPAAVDLMILRALLAQPILTPDERDAAAAKAAGARPLSR